MIRSSFFNSIGGDRKYDASKFAEYFNSFIGNGVFPTPLDGLQVVSNDDMTVTVKEGKAWINGYIMINDDDYILPIDVADGVLKRIDRVVVRLDTTDREIRVEVKKGAFASSPIAPTLQRDADAYELGIADILISNGVVSITTANITDTRSNSELCGKVDSLIAGDINSLVTSLNEHKDNKASQTELGHIKFEDVGLWQKIDTFTIDTNVVSVSIPVPINLSEMRIITTGLNSQQNNQSLLIRVNNLTTSIYDCLYFTNSGVVANNSTFWTLNTILRYDIAQSTAFETDIINLNGLAPLFKFTSHNNYNYLGNRLLIASIKEDIKITDIEFYVVDTFITRGTFEVWGR